MSNHHNHRKPVKGCHRCELTQDELGVKKKPGFLEGLTDALHTDEAPAVSEQVLVAMQAIDELELTTKERSELIGALAGDLLKTSLLDALSGGDGA